MKETQSRYLHWLNNPNITPSLLTELQAIQNDPAEITDRFYKDLDFGTAGLRGIIGAGTNRMNIYTVRKATQGLANYINKLVSGDKSVVIAYDTRYMSREFALESALTLARNKIKAFLFREVTATPILSYAIGYLQASAGIVITASHNPKEYNGYKVYWSHGGQVVNELALAITNEIRQTGDELAIPAWTIEEAEQAGLLTWVDDDVYQSYLAKVNNLILRPELIRQETDSLKIVYTPLHGTGNKPVLDLLKTAGFQRVYPVNQQTSPDPEFTTVTYPNPEEPAAYELALAKAREISADLILSTDPDADRIGVMVKDNSSEYQLITGNQLGALLIDYILRARQEMGTIPANGVIIKTIVTSAMGSEIAAKYGVKTLDVLTGFKYIGEKIAQYEKDQSQTFLFGYEESYGFLAGDFVRDKDAVQICLLVCEMAAYYRTKQQSLLDRLDELYQELGYYKEDLLNINLAGIAGQEKIARIIESWRNNPPLAIGDTAVAIVADYHLGQIQKISENKISPTNLPQSNVLHYTLADDSWFCIRPSGTEPKLKIYFGVKDTTSEAAINKLNRLREDVLNRVNSIK